MKMPGEGQRIFWEENAVLFSSLIILKNNTAVLSGLGWRAVKLFFFLKSNNWEIIARNIICKGDHNGSEKVLIKEPGICSQEMCKTNASCVGHFTQQVTRSVCRGKTVRKSKAINLQSTSLC